MRPFVDLHKMKMNARLKDYFSENDYLRTDVAATLGVSRAILSRLVTDGELQRIAQGVYALPDTLADDLVVIAGRSKNIVFSHETALALHGLHNRIPARPSVTVPQGANAPHSVATSVKVYRVRPECHGLGLADAVTPFGHRVPCYDPERTICDVIRSYSRMDIETYANALRTYAKRRPDFPKLMSYARALGIESKVRKAIEVLT